MIEEDHVRVEDRGHARVVTLCRTDKRNALSRRMVERLATIVEQAGLDERVRGVVLGAEGAVFMAGADLGELAAALDQTDAAEGMLAMGARLSVIEASPLPIVCAVGGDVFGGGCEVTLLCDAVIAERQAGFTFRHARMGLSPAWGGARRLVERVGPLGASRLLLTAERVTADEALALGLVTSVVDDGRALDAACELVEHFAKNDRNTVAENKRGLMAARGLPSRGWVEAEAAVFRSLWAGPAHLAAMARAAKKAGAS